MTFLEICKEEIKRFGFTELIELEQGKRYITLNLPGKETVHVGDYEELLAALTMFSSKYIRNYNKRRPLQLMYGVLHEGHFRSHLYLPFTDRWQYPDRAMLQAFNHKGCVKWNGRTYYTYQFEEFRRDFIQQTSQWILEDYEETTERFWYRFDLSWATQSKIKYPLAYREVSEALKEENTLGHPIFKPFTMWDKGALHNALSRFPNMLIKDAVLRL